MLWSFFVSKIVSLADDFMDRFWDTESSSTEKMMMNKKRIRILIADDNQTVRKGLKALLTSFSREQEYRMNIEIVGEAENGLEAVALAQDLVPDLILMDIKMPLMDGLEATRMIKEKLEDTRVVVLSMHSDQSEAAIQGGADGFIEKGTDPQTIKQMVARFILKKGE